MNRLIIGIGNHYRHDDAVGLIVVRKLKEKNLPHCSFAEASGEGTQLMDLWKEASNVILIDALSSNQEPGSIRRFEADKNPLPSETFRYSTHAFSIGEAIELARALNQLPSSIIVYGIEGKNFEAGEGLSPTVERAAERVINEITLELKTNSPS